jgi:glycerol uptake facilitator-like aquaporin
MVALLSRLANGELRSVEGALVGSAALGLGTALVITTFAPISKSQANPFVSVLASFGGRQPWTETVVRVVSQVFGAGIATILAVLVPAIVGERGGVAKRAPARRRRRGLRFSSRRVWSCPEA